jgi:hypothetical protein
MKLTKFQTPTGATGDVLNPSSWLSLVIGSVVLIITFALGQNVANKIGSKVPGVDAEIDQPWKDDRPPKTENRKRVL